MASSQLPRQMRGVRTKAGGPSKEPKVTFRPDLSGLYHAVPTDRSFVR